MGAILDRITKEGLTEEMTYELRPEGNRGMFQTEEHPSRANTLKEVYVVSSEEQESIWLGQNMGRIMRDNVRSYWGVHSGPGRSC